MLYFGICICAISTFFLIWTGKWKSPLLLYNVLWTVILSLYSLHLFGLFSVSFLTESVILLSLLFFNIGYMLVLNNSRIRCSAAASAVRLPKYENYFFLKITAVYTIIVSLPFNINRIQFMINNHISPYLLKFYRMEGLVEEDSGFMQVLERPFEIILIIVSAYYIILNRKQMFLILSGIYISVIRYITLGSRMAILLYAIALVAVLLNNEHFRFILKKYKKVFIGIILFAILYVFRFVSSYSELYKYLTGCVPMLDKIVNQQDGVYDYGHTYGFESTFAIWRSIWAVFHRLGLGESFMAFKGAQNAFKYIIDIQAYYQPIGDGVAFNAFVSYIASFFIDFSYVGVVMLSFLYGFILGQIEVRQNVCKKLYYTILMYFSYYYIFSSMVRFQLTDMTFGLAFIYTVLLKRRIMSSKRIVFSISRLGKKRFD